MQDKDNFHDPNFNEEFLDRAWSQMSSMLDKEMPVVVESVVQEEGWKRYLLLFLSLSFGVAIGAALVLFWPSHPLEDSEGQPDINRIYAQDAAPSPNSSSSSQPEGSVANVQDISNATTVFSNPVSSSQNSIAYNNNYTLSSTLPATNTQPQINTEPIDNSAAMMPINRSPLAVFSQLKHRMPHLAMADDRVLPEKQPATTPLVTPKHQLKKERPTLGMSVGMLTENYEEADGFEAGLRAEIPLNEKFSVQTGAYYRTMTKNKRADYAGSLEEPGATGGQSNLETSSFPVYSMQYVAVPVALNYKLAKNVKVSAGVDVAYLTRARIGDNPIGFLDNSGSEEIANDLPAYLEQGMRRWDVSASVGVSYQPTDRIIIDARYNLGMTDFTKNNIYGIQALNNHRYLKVGLNYLFTNRS